MIHSAAFRRLQAKTQVLGVGESDFYRTRLTHSLEVAQIGGGILGQLKRQGQEAEWGQHLPSDSLVETICLAHDIGHPPFGHGGEVALNYLMRHSGGFEGNGQTLRIVCRLEKYKRSFGMDLTRRAALGVLKYPSPHSVAVRLNAYPSMNSGDADQAYLKASDWKPPKSYFDDDQDIVDWVLEPLSASDRNRFQRVDEGKKHAKPVHKSFDTTIMDLADDIAYGVHDLEDALSLKLVTRQQWDEQVAGILAKLPSWSGIAEELSRDLFSECSFSRKKTIGDLVNRFVTRACVEADPDFEEPLLRYSVTLPSDEREALDLLQNFIRDKVILQSSVQLLEFKDQQMIMELFAAFAADPDRLLPSTTLILYKEADESKRLRVICDYISGMTDDYATKQYQRLFMPRAGSIFDRH